MWTFETATAAHAYSELTWQNVVCSVREPPLLLAFTVFVYLMMNGSRLMLPQSVDAAADAGATQHVTCLSAYNSISANTVFPILVIQCFLLFF